MKNIFPKTQKIGRVWCNPYNGWLYEYKKSYTPSGVKIKGWVCIEVNK